MIRFLIALCVVVLTIIFGLVITDYQANGHTTHQPLVAWVMLFALKYYQAWHVWCEAK